ncbi:MAG TPA: PVC-type heme-binding CxxCH protein [Fimbriiglobus sp.]|jgi:putative membrane-bound dehydrogenase-like protein
MTPLLLATLLLAADPTPKEGVLPVGADDKPLNLDFETGTLKDWTADGDAFAGQPIRGDTVTKRRGDMKSGHQGDYWIGGFEKLGDKPTGTLTSVPFKVTHPWASFLIGGGKWTDTCVELVLKPGNQVISRTSGLDDETMKRVAVDLTKYVGKEIQIRLVDRNTGGWGHLNFDDFRLHSEKPQVPARAPQVVLKPDVLKYAGLPPEKAASVMTVPEGFKVTLFAGEPDVHQPIAFAIDDRGRLWVAEAYAYPRRLPFPGPVLPEEQKKNGDRILIFEDTDGDGKFDKKTVFMEGLNLVSGLEVGFGGVWVGAAPYLMFIPLDAKTDKPAGPPQVLLDGFDAVSDTHETLNTFTWGPDGWLYGCHGVFTRSRVGKPGTPDKDRTPLNAGVWRYHPTKHIFEVFAYGTSNPWGLDYNAQGEFFIEACVIPHCWHMFQEGRYERQAGQHFQPYTYDDIKTIADHRHYLGATPHGGNNKSDAAGGGHAHCGLMCYLGGAWPAQFTGQLFMGNIHGKRINMDILHPNGSGYVASHGKDFLLANDDWAKFINLKYGPDGNVYLIDWYDKQACHLPNPEVWDRTNGRIYKVSYQGTKPVVGIDLQKCTDEELVNYQLDKNDWYARHARRILQERAGEIHGDATRSEKVRTALDKIAKENQAEAIQLRVLWTLDVLGDWNAKDLSAAQVGKLPPQIAGWELQMAAEDGKQVVLQSFPSPVLRRHALSALLKLPPEDRWSELSDLASYAEDERDPNLPYMLWYAMEPLGKLDPARALTLAADAKVSRLLPYMARRIASIGSAEAFGVLIAKLTKTDDTAKQLAILRGTNEALKGRRRMAMPTGWTEAYAKLGKSSDPEIRNQALALAVTFGDTGAMAMLRDRLADPKAEIATRREAMVSLLGASDKNLPPVLQKLLGDTALRGAALRGLAAFDDPKTPAAILAVYSALPISEKRDAVSTLTARSSFAGALLDAIGEKKIPASDVPAGSIRQLRNLGNKDLDAKIVAVWGVIRNTPADKKRLIADWKRKLSASYQGPQDLALGRAVFAKTCQHCHTLYGLGGKVGPDITGSNRSDLNYLLENIFDPSAVIPKDYAATKLDLADGRVVTGIIKEETPATLTVATERELLIIPVKDVDKRTPSPLSMMPDDLTKQAKEPEIRALVAYLRSNQQVPMKATEENVKDFFNGKDLTGWDATPGLWSVENGEIVGKSATGIKKNDFLKSQIEASDFRLTLKIKLTPNKENSGIQFRSEPIEGGEMRGPQADAGAGWWGKLYEESGRGLLWKESGEKYLKPDQWNDYVVEAKGSHVRTWINGNLCVDLDDPKISKKGIFGLQMHAGGPIEVRFKDLKLELLN